MGFGRASNPELDCTKLVAKLQKNDSAALSKCLPEDKPQFFAEVLKFCSFYRGQAACADRLPILPLKDGSTARIGQNNAIVATPANEVGAHRQEEGQSRPRAPSPCS